MPCYRTGTLRADLASTTSPSTATYTSQKGGRLIGFDAHKKVNRTKIHAVVNEESAPIAVTIGKGSEHEGRKLIPLMKSISIRHGKGRPRKNPRRVYGDTKYSMDLNRFYLDKRKIRSQIPSMAKKCRLGRKANAPRQGDLQEGQIHSREILRMDKAIQEADSKVRKTGRDIPGINPHCLHRDTVESIEIGSI